MRLTLPRLASRRASDIAVGLFLTCLSQSGFAQMPDPVAASGYEQSKQGEEVLRKALKTANAILASSSVFVVTSRSDQAPAKTGTKSFLSVYSVKPTNPPFVIQVPFRSCNC